MKKVGILTFHCADNYGAVLQCLGLQEFLITKGYEVKIINYKPKYLLEKHSCFVNPIKRFQEYKKEKYNKSIVIKKTIKSFFENIYLPKKIARKLKFRNYRNEYLNQSIELNNYNDVNKFIKDYDILICGSDQIWNKNATNDIFDKVFFLDFDNDNIIKISYAASAGSQINEKDRLEFESLINKFNNISVREERLLNQVKEWTNKSAKLVIDPSMLLTREQWSKFEKRTNISGKYILVYCLENNDEMKKIIKYVYEKLNVKIIEIDIRKRLSENGKAINKLNPGEFLSVIKNAEFIITNSFHGTVFSILYKKNFICIPHLKLGERMRTLLMILGLEEKLIIDESNKKNIFSKIDYKKVNTKLKILREEGIEFLQQSIEGE